MLVCVSHLLAHFALAVPQGPGPPLHVERSSSGHFPPPAPLNNEPNTKKVEQKKTSLSS